MLRRRLIILAVMVFVASMVFAVVPASGANGGVGFAWVRVAHASPDAPNVDILVNDQVAVSNLAFAEVTGYLLVPAGDYNVKVVPTGEVAPVVINADLTLDKSTAYTVAARGLLGDDSIDASVFVDDNAWPAPGQAKVNFIHLSPDAPNVDIWVNGAVVISDLAFPDASPYLEVPAGDYNVQVTPTGAVAPIVIDINVTLEAGTVYTAFAEGLLAGPPNLQAVLASFAPKGAVWYLAEGCTEADFETFVLVQNPGPEPATVGLTFMTDEGAVAGPIGTLPPGSRATWKANDYVTSWNVSTLVTANQPVVAERAMYGNNRIWAHDSIGVVSPSQTWYLAEGSTEGGMETFVLVQNPGETAANVKLTFMTDSGPKEGPEMELPPHSRWTWKVNDYVTTWNVSTSVEANAPVVAERAMYGNNRTWAHDSIGYAP